MSTKIQRIRNTKATRAIAGTEVEVKGLISSLLGPDWHDRDITECTNACVRILQIGYGIADLDDCVYTYINDTLHIFHPSELEPA